MRYAVEGLILLANMAIDRIKRELGTTHMRTRIYGPMEDIVIALKGLISIFSSNPVLSSMLSSFLFNVEDNKRMIREYEKTTGIEGLMSDWTIRFEEIERDCYNFLKK